MFYRYIMIKAKCIHFFSPLCLQFELLPVTNIIPTARVYLQDRVEGYELEEMENRFDDLRSALDLANEFLKSTNEPNDHDDVMKFIGETKKVEKVFRKAISYLGKEKEAEQVEASQEAYEQAIGGLYIDGKFVHHWKKIQSTKVKKMDSSQLYLRFLEGLSSNRSNRRDPCFKCSHELG